MTERENFCRNIAAVSYGRYNGRKGDRKACGRTLTGMYKKMGPRLRDPLSWLLGINSIELKKNPKRAQQRFLKKLYVSSA